MKYLLPQSKTQYDVESACFTVGFMRGYTYPVSNHEDFERVWYKGDISVIYRSVPTFGGAIITFTEEDEDTEALKVLLGVYSFEEVVKQMDFVEDRELPRELSRFSLLGWSLRTQDIYTGPLYAHWSRALNSEETQIKVAALKAASLLYFVPGVEEDVETLQEDPVFGNLATQVFRQIQDRKQPFYHPTRNIDVLLGRAHDGMARGDWAFALESAQAALLENEYLLEARKIQAEAFGQLEDHWAAWFAMEYTLANTYEDAFVEEKPEMIAFLEKERALALEGQDVTQAARNVALSFLRTGLYEAQSLEALFEHDPDWRARWLFVFKLYGLRDSFEPVIELEPDSVVLLPFKGELLWRAGDEEAAFETWNQWLDAVEDWVLQPGSFDEFAYEWYDYAMFGPPTLGRVFSALAHELSGDWPRLERLVELWFKDEPDFYLPHLHLGLCHTFQDRPDEAIESYTRAIDLYHSAGMESFGDSPISTAYFNRACELGKKGLLESTVFADLEEAVALSRRYAQMAVEDDYMKPVMDDPRFERAIRLGLARAAEHDQILH